LTAAKLNSADKMPTVMNLLPSPVHCISVTVFSLAAA
jgi:hypothetical protein